MHTRIATTDGATPMTTKPTALDAHMAHHAATLALLARITEHLANHDDAPAEGVDWGHVGDIAATRGTLQELSDRLFSEGEHAEVACLRCPATFGTGAELATHYRAAH